MPFFYLGDTAWSLFHRTTREEAEHYLRDRAAKGFTVIQAVVLAEFDGLHTPNSNGDCPLYDDDPTRPNEAYFSFVDWVVESAGELGLWMGMLPTWGDKWSQCHGDGPEIFTPENARIYGERLAKRYADADIIWILGGDRAVQNDGHRAITEQMAAGIEEGDDGAHLQTFHPNGQHTSAEWFHEAPWLDFNMWQTGHTRDRDNYRSIAEDYALKPPKPCLDSEPGYEDHNTTWNGERIRLNALDTRKAAYWSLFSGACGHTYGSIDVCLFWKPGVPTFKGGSNRPWREALQLPGAFQMRHARALLESRPFISRIPDQSLILSSHEDPANHLAATRDTDGSYALIYIPDGRAVTIDLSCIAGETVSAHWFDPRSGQAEEIGSFSTSEAREFAPPAREDAPDWVLVLDDAARGFSLPGQVSNSSEINGKI